MDTSGQKRLGELTAKIDPAVRKGNQHTGVAVMGGKTKQLTDMGMSSQQTSDAERIAREPEILDRVIRRAQERNDIPTKSEVVKRRFAFFDDASTGLWEPAISMPCRWPARSSRVRAVERFSLRAHW